MIQITSVTMVVVLFSGMIPAIQASRLQPLEVLRGQHEIRVSSRRVQEFTSNLPATMGLTIRSSIRKPTRLAFTFLAVGLSMLLFGSTLLMMATMEDMTIGSIEENQNWDVQAMVLPGGDQEVIEWAEDRGGIYERVIDFPASPIGDSRVISANGLDVLSQNSDSLIVLDLKEGRLPEQGRQDFEVLIDEGLSYFLGWETDEIQTLVFGSESIDVKIVGITKGEISRTVYFHRLDLADIVGLDATAVLIDLPDGVPIDGELGDVSLVVIEKQNLVSSFEAILEQQQGFLGAIMFLGILIALVVLFNTLIINLSERDREIATLRVLGAPISRLGWMMLGEHLADRPDRRGAGIYVHLGWNTSIAIIVQLMDILCVNIGGSSSSYATNRDCRLHLRHPNTLWDEANQEDGFGREGQRPITVAHDRESRDLESEWHPSSP